MAASSPTPTPFGSGTGLRGEYYGYSRGAGANADPIDYLQLAGMKLDTQFDGNVFQPANSTPGFGLDRYRFAVRWTGYIQPRYSEYYTFKLIPNNGAKLWINSQLVIDLWTSGSFVGNMSLVANQKYPITLEFWKDSNLFDPGLTLKWSSASETEAPVPASQLYPPAPSTAVGAGNGNGLLGHYFDDRNTNPHTYFTQDVGSRLDPIAGQPGTPNNEFSMEWSGFSGGPDFRDAGGHPLLGSTDYSARWTGSIQPRFSETYIFELKNDDGARLWVNGQLLIDGWSGVSTRRAKIDLVAGQLYPIKIEYWQGGAFAYIVLSWISYSQPFQAVPTSQLYSSDSSVVPNTTTPTATLSNMVGTWTPTATSNGTPTRTPAASATPDFTPLFITCNNNADLIHIQNSTFYDEYGLKLMNQPGLYPQANVIRRRWPPSKVLWMSHISQVNSTDGSTWYKVKVNPSDSPIVNDNGTAIGTQEKIGAHVKN